MTFLDLYREKYERRGGTAARFVEAYRQADPEQVVDYLLEHNPDGVRGTLIVTATEFRNTGRTHSNALVALLQEGRAALIYDRLAADLPELPEPFAGEQRYDVDWAVDRRDLLNWVK
jgi:hypothetical protein